MGQCQTCKHWVGPMSGKMHGLCLEIVDENDWKDPASQRAYTVGFTKHDSLVRTDSSALRTLPTFGCELYKIQPALGPPGSVVTISEN